MPDTANVVVIGAGIIGLCTAVQIRRRSSARIVVVDKGIGPGEGSTGASSAICRFRYSRPETVGLALDGARVYRNWGEFLRADQTTASFNNDGVLWLALDDHTVSEEVSRLTALGVRVERLSDRDVRERYPALNTCILAPDLEAPQGHKCVSDGQHLLEVDGGHVDPSYALGDLIDAARRMGIEVRFRAPVVDVVVANSAVKGVGLADGTAISCEYVVNAAGPWCNSILERAGVASGWPLTPTRIQIVHADRSASIKGHIPVCVDLAAGIYFRTQNQGQQLIVGSVLEADELEVVTDPDHFATYVDDEFVRTKLHALQHRVPGFDYVGQIRGYSGLYTINRRDVHPVVGETAIKGLYTASGCSGHGFKLAPAIGSLLAQAITGQRDEFDTSVDAHFLALTRNPIVVATKSALA